MNQVDLKFAHQFIIVSVIRLSNLDDGFLYDFLIVFNVVFGLQTECWVGVDGHQP